MTATNTDLLMWGHYADGHRGFCLEFDCAWEPFSTARQVRYTNEFPRLSPGRIWADGGGEQLEALILTKADCWQYEQEWRLFHMEPNRPFTYDWKALTGVYFGAAMPLAHQEIIAMVLRDSPTQLYRMSRSSAQFGLVTEAADYRPFDYRGRSTPGSGSASGDR